MIYSAVSIICIALLCGIAFGFIFNLLRRGRSGRVDFIRKFKKGNCAIVYTVAIPLYWIGHIYSGQSPLPALFSAINKTMGLVVLGYDMSGISALIDENRFYSLAVYLCFVLVAVNAMLFAFSLLHQKLWEWKERRCWDFTRRGRLLIVGNNDENLKIYSSERTRRAILLDDLSESDKTRLYSARIGFITRSKDSVDCKGKKADTRSGIEKYCCDMVEIALKKPRRDCVIVINTGCDDTNIAICHKLLGLTSIAFNGKGKDEIAGVLNRIRIYVFGMPTQETVYDSIVQSSGGCIRYVNKYRCIATDFIDSYPLTRFMTEDQIDYESSLLKEGVRINVALIGFGRTNRQIMLTSVANNQFLSLQKGERKIKPVNYYIFDKNHPENNKNLNHSYYRYKTEFGELIEQDKEYTKDSPYLPLPQLPSREIYDGLDVNDPDFYKDLRPALSGEGSFNYVIISFGSDLENIDMAHKIIEKKTEWGLKNTYIFVKVRSGDKTHSIFDRDDCFLIGDEQSAVYNMARIDDDSISRMARMRNRIYSLEYEISSTGKQPSAERVKEIYTVADCDWYTKKTQLERESNLYACLSLRSKLNMMGLDYCPKEDADKSRVLDSKAYANCYAKGDPIEYYDGLEADGKKIVKYGIDFKKSRRNSMALQEHLRWNSFMISKGFIPASKKEILEDTKSNGKSYVLRRHGNLTTFEGLYEFREMICRRDDRSEASADVIKYDYQLLDDAHWLLDGIGYSIISIKDQAK